MPAGLPYLIVHHEEPLHPSDSLLEQHRALAAADPAADFHLLDYLRRRDAPDFNRVVLDPRLCNYLSPVIVGKARRKTPLHGRHIGIVTDWMGDDHFSLAFNYDDGRWHFWFGNDVDGRGAGSIKGQNTLVVEPHDELLGDVHGEYRLLRPRLEPRE